ncbi:MAG: polyprenyl diphosphate synthase [Nanoarchaeota archaeon]
MKEKFPENVPRHIGIILDGNRRFAKQLMLKPWKGHEWGKEKVKKLIGWCGDLKIHEVTLYAFSIQNFSRPKEEFNYIMQLFEDAARELLVDKRIDENRIRIRFIGRIKMFPQRIYALMQEIMEKTKKHDKYLINFAMAYGGREEVLDAVKKIAAEAKMGEIDVEKINEELFSDHLNLNSEPDLIIRTGGERRTSNFLIWQSNYSEWIFLEKKWPEFEKEDLVECIQEYQHRQRRFGK